MRTLLLATMLATLVAPRAHAQSFGIFSTPDCSSCNLSIPMDGTGTFYVRALTGFLEHLTGAELRVVGLPPEWQVVSVTPNPQSNVSIGSLLGAGANIAFPSDQEGDCIGLYTVVIRATTAATDVTLRVTRHSTPSNPNFPCPVIVPNCWRKAEATPTCFWLVCASGGSMFVNSSANCMVGVQPSTWSALKQLYEE